MKSKILISWESGLPKGSIINVFEEGHRFSSSESMQAFILEGGLAKDFKRTFIILNVLDRSREQLLFLLDATGNIEPEAKYSFSPPLINSVDYEELNLAGEASRNWSEITPYLIEVE